MFAVDLERVEGLVPARVASRFEGGEGAILESGQERAGVVDADLLDFAGEVVFALFDKGLSHRADFVDGTVHPDGGINAMRQQIAGHARASRLQVQAPERGAALGQLRADGPILEKLRSIMKDAAQPALIDQLL